jgi:tetratricopeptide (TPR) repeat protein
MLKRLPLLIAALALAIWVGAFIIRNFLAASLIAYGQDETSRDAAAHFAPHHPGVIAARGKFLLYRAEPPRPEEAISELRRAVLASPYDYRFWLELGRAYENTGDATRAETALRRATQLAPRYFETRWALANLLLRARRGDTLAAFRHALEASGADPEQTDWRAALNAYDTIAKASENNLSALFEVAPPDNVAQAALAYSLAEHDDLDQSLEIWRRLPVRESVSYRRIVIQLLKKLRSRGRFTAAREVWNSVESWARSDGGLAVANYQPNLIINGGFERAPVSERIPELNDPPAGFDWVIGRHPEVRARRAEMEKHGGAQALHLSFAAAMRSEYRGISQIVAVEPRQSYRLSFFVKTRNVPQSPDEVSFIEISDPLRPAQFAVRAVVPGGSSDWREQAINFTTPADTYGINLTVCSPRLSLVDHTRIAELWFDDFKMEKRN